MKNFLQDYFYYSRAERQGALVLAALILLAFLLPALLGLLPERNAPGFEPFQREVAAFLAADSASIPGPLAPFYFDPNTLSPDSLQLLGLPPKVAATIVKYREKVSPFYRVDDLRKIYTLQESDYRRLAPFVRIAPPKEKAAPANFSKAAEPFTALFLFDPNRESKEGLLRLGLSEKVVSNILKYRAKGGSFPDAASLKKVYGLSASDFERLAPYVQIEQEPEEPPVGAPDGRPDEYPALPVRAPVAIDINRATAEEWQQLRGIGPAYSRRITNFRDKLGGFTTIEQVAETYGLPDSTFHDIKEQLRHSPIFRKLRINELGASQLQEHPYLNWRQAKAIVSYRDNHGPFQGIEDVRRVRVLPDEVVLQLSPYLEF